MGLVEALHDFCVVGGFEGVYFKIIQKHTTYNQLGIHLTYKLL